MAQTATDVQCPRLNIFLEDIDMDAICTDLLWRTLSMLDGNIYYDVEKHADCGSTPDRVSQDEWKLLYFAWGVTSTGNKRRSKQQLTTNACLQHVCGMDIVS